MRSYLWLLLVVGCAPAGGGGDGGGGGSGGSGGGEQRDACEPPPGTYTATWTLDAVDSDEDCPPIDPTTSRFGDGGASCTPGCTCGDATVQEDGQCIASATVDCDDYAIVCGFGFQNGDREIPGRCEMEFVDDAGEVIATCRYGVELVRQ